MAFRYDIGTLIQLIETKPIIWDKTVEHFKDRTRRHNAWEEICAFLEEDFYEKDIGEQDKLVAMLIAKWQNIRDAFVKSLKKRASATQATKKYIYHDYLLFLYKVLPKDDKHLSIADFQQSNENELNSQAVESIKNETHYQSSNDDNADFQESIENETVIQQYDEASDNEELIEEPEIEIQVLPPIEELSSPDNHEEYHPRKKLRMQQKIVNKPHEKIDKFQEKIDRNMFNIMNNQLPDEDEAFFISITPAVKKMSDTDKLDFRIKVLQVIRELQNRKVSPSSAESAFAGFTNSPLSSPKFNNKYL